MSDSLSFTRKTDYYKQPTHEFNLPAGWACPFADACKTKADRDTGKLIVRPNPRVSTAEPFVCYAARAERFPGVRDSRWGNFENVRDALKSGAVPFGIPRTATHVRIHGSGDFFSEEYFRAWCDTAAAYPQVQFWAFTKSINYWVDNQDRIPPNLALTASTGSVHDSLAVEHGLRTATVYYHIEDIPEDMVIDTDDGEAQDPLAPSFALLENQSNRKQTTDKEILDHNRRAYTLQGLV